MVVVLFLRGRAALLGFRWIQFVVGVSLVKNAIRQAELFDALRLVLLILMMLLCMSGLLVFEGRLFNYLADVMSSGWWSN